MRSDFKIWYERCNQYAASLTEDDLHDAGRHDAGRRRGPGHGRVWRSITRFARKHNIPFAWQTRFHDHIIRDTDEMNDIADYIENNVAKWQNDKFNA